MEIYFEIGCGNLSENTEKWKKYLETNIPINEFEMALLSLKEYYTKEIEFLKGLCNNYESELKNVEKLIKIIREMNEKLK